MPLGAKGGGKHSKGWQANQGKGRGQATGGGKPSDKPYLRPKPQDPQTPNRASMSANASPGTTAAATAFSPGEIKVTVGTTSEQLQENLKKPCKEVKKLERDEKKAKKKKRSRSTDSSSSDSSDSSSSSSSDSDYKKKEKKKKK